MGQLCPGTCDPRKEGETPVYAGPVGRGKTACLISRTLPSERQVSSHVPRTEGEDGHPGPGHGRCVNVYNRAPPAGRAVRRGTVCTSTLTGHPRLAALRPPLRHRTVTVGQLAGPPGPREQDPLETKVTPSQEGPGVGLGEEQSLTREPRSGHWREGGRCTDDRVVQQQHNSNHDQGTAALVRPMLLLRQRGTRIE